MRITNFMRIILIFRLIAACYGGDDIITLDIGAEADLGQEMDQNLDVTLQIDSDVSVGLGGVSSVKRKHPSEWDHAGYGKNMPPLQLDPAATLGTKTAPSETRSAPA